MRICYRCFLFLYGHPTHLCTCAVQDTRTGKFVCTSDGLRPRQSIWAPNAAKELQLHAVTLVGSQAEATTKSCRWPEHSIATAMRQPWQATFPGVLQFYCTPHPHPHPLTARHPLCLCATYCMLHPHTRTRSPRKRKGMVLTDFFLRKAWQIRSWQHVLLCLFFLSLEKHVWKGNTIF
jgi:hypothetical protein